MKLEDLIEPVSQGTPKIFLSTCPLDKHYIKFGCPKPKGSCPKRFAQNSKTIGHLQLQIQGQQYREILYMAALVCPHNVQTLTLAQ